MIGETGDVTERWKLRNDTSSLLCEPWNLRNSSDAGPNLTPRRLPGDRLILSQNFQYMLIEQFCALRGR